MQSEVIRATGAPETPDPRLAGKDAGELGVNELFVGEDEVLHAVAGPTKNLDVVDEDEDACSLVVVGYPNYASLERLADYFENVAVLRKPPARLPGVTTERVVVTFEKEKDLQFAMDWFQNPQRTMVAGHVVAVERVKPVAKGKGDEIEKEKE